jgi:putative membrane protein
MHFLLRLIINGIVFYCLPYFIHGIHANSFGAAVLAAFIFGVVNAIVRPLVLLLTLPFTILTLGLFVIIVNALMFWLATWIAPGFKVDGFIPALEGGIIMMIVGIITNHLLRERRPVRTTAQT